MRPHHRQAGISIHMCQIGVGRGVGFPFSGWKTKTLSCGQLLPDRLPSLPFSLP
jgi:hypothetical protein